MWQNEFLIFCILAFYIGEHLQADQVSQNPPFLQGHRIFLLNPVDPDETEIN